MLSKPEHALSSVQSSAQSQLHTEDIEFLYDMEFFINRQLGASVKTDFDEEAFRKALSVNGDSIIVISDDETIKVHVHSKTPGEVLNLALVHGEITQIHILNMREQHRDLLTAGMDIAPMPDVFADIPEEKASVPAAAWFLLQMIWRRTASLRSPQETESRISSAVWVWMRSGLRPDDESQHRGFRECDLFHFGQAYLHSAE